MKPLKVPGTADCLPWHNFPSLSYLNCYSKNNKCYTSQLKSNFKPDVSFDATTTMPTKVIPSTINNCFWVSLESIGQSEPAYVRKGLPSVPYLVFTRAPSPAIHWWQVKFMLIRTAKMD
eukprot:2216796-Amphidinium_carterae.1